MPILTAETLHQIPPVTSVEWKILRDVLVAAQNLTTLITGLGTRTEEFRSLYAKVRSAQIVEG